MNFVKNEINLKNNEKQNNKNYVVRSLNRPTSTRCSQFYYEYTWALYNDFQRIPHTETFNEQVSLCTWIPFVTPSLLYFFSCLIYGNLFYKLVITVVHTN